MQMVLDFHIHFYKVNLQMSSPLSWWKTVVPFRWGVLNYEWLFLMVPGWVILFVS